MWISALGIFTFRFSPIYHKSLLLHVIRTWNVLPLEMSQTSDSSAAKYSSFLKGFSFCCCHLISLSLFFLKFPPNLLVLLFSYFLHRLWWYWSLDIIFYSSPLLVFDLDVNITILCVVCSGVSHDNMHTLCFISVIF